MGTPTLIWENKENQINGRNFYSSPSPYISAATGLLFSDLNKFKSGIVGLLNPLLSGESRKWVMQNLTDDICAEKLFRKFCFNE